MHWNLERAQEDGKLVTELLHIFSDHRGVMMVSNLLNPRRDEQTHAIDLVLQLEVQWVRLCVPGPVEKAKTCTTRFGSSGSIHDMLLQGLDGADATCLSHNGYGILYS